MTSINERLKVAAAPCELIGLVIEPQQLLASHKEKKRKPFLLASDEREHRTQSLAEDSKLESDQVCGRSCQFSGNTEPRETHSVMLPGCISKMQTLGDSSGIFQSKLQGKGRGEKKARGLKET